MDEMYWTLRAGRCLKALIYQNHSTLQEFADEINVDVSQVIRWCNKGIGKVHNIQYFAEKLGVDFFEFFQASQ